MLRITKERLEEVKIEALRREINKEMKNIRKKTEKEIRSKIKIIKELEQDLKT